MACPPVELVPTGLPPLDKAIGGLPRGRIVDIYGEPGSGKTALALHLSARLGGPVLYVDADHGLSPYILGDRELYLLNVDTLEDALDAGWTAAVGGFSAIVLDTVAALPTRGDMPNKQARVLSKCLPRFLALLHKTGCTLILVEQMRDKPGVRFGNPTHPTGGRAVGCFASLRLETVPTTRIKAGRDVVGQSGAICVHKCKYGPHGMRVWFKMIYPQSA